MRTETRKYKVYKLEELTKEAQEKAYIYWQSHHEYCWNDDNLKTLHAFEKIFNIKAINWSYDTCNYTYSFTSDYSEDEENMKGIRLLKYLVNNYWDYLYIPETYHSKDRTKKRKSHLFVSNDCVLTGYYIDCDILDPIYDFIKAPDDTTLYELMDKCLDKFFKACKDDMEYGYNEEAFAEDCEINEYEFLKDGTRFE